MPATGADRSRYGRLFSCLAAAGMGRTVSSMSVLKEPTMAYLAPAEFVTKMVDAGESKVFMSTKDTFIRAYMAGAILALAAWFAVTINVNTGQPIVSSLRVGWNSSTSSSYESQNSRSIRGWQS